jgi:hypothetical protein
MTQHPEAGRGTTCLRHLRGGEEFAFVLPLSSVAHSIPHDDSPGYPKVIESDMKDIILSMPASYLYLAFVVALLIMALWAREPGAPAGNPRGTTLATGRGLDDARVAAQGNHDRTPLWGSAWPSQRDGRPFRDLEATLSASYVVRFEQAIRTIRVPLGGRGLWGTFQTCRHDVQPGRS